VTPSPSFEKWLRPGARIAFGDGVGAPTALAAEISKSASRVGEVELLLSWVPHGQLAFDLGAFNRIRTLMGGYALRTAIDEGAVEYVPARLGTTPALLNHTLRPDVLVLSVGKGPDGYRLTTESAWQRAAVDTGAQILALERTAVPVLDAGPPLPTDRIHLIDSIADPPACVEWGEPAEIHRAVAAQVVPLIPSGARMQFGPGPVGTAVLEAIDQPIHIDTGMLTDAVVDLDRRGLLLGTALAPYLGGTGLLYDWAPGRAVVDRLETTHDPVRLSSQPPLVAVNTALEVDLDGQVNVEAVGGSAVAGIGGHPDYAFAAARAIDGLSIVALPTQRGRHRTLVDRLSSPASTASHDIDAIVTERGAADLRGLDRRGRRRAIEALWN
jgi:acyl-CoA hydrolase